MTGISLGNVVLDCPEPHALAEFYRGVLGGEVSSEDPDWADLTVDGHAGVLVTSLGATPLDPGEPPSEDGRTWRAYADPAGHPFCLCTC